MRSKVLVTITATLALLVVWVPSASAKASWTYGNGPTDLAVDTVATTGSSTAVCRHITGLAGQHSESDPWADPANPPTLSSGFTVSLYVGAFGSLEGAQAAPGGLLLQDGTTTVGPTQILTTVKADPVQPADIYDNPAGGSYYEYSSAPFSFTLPPDTPAWSDVVIQNGSQALFRTSLADCTTTVLTSKTNPSSGQNGSFTATVKFKNGDPVTKGGVQFLVDGNEIAGNVPLDSLGQATYAGLISFLTPGDHVVSANYLGAANPPNSLTPPPYLLGGSTGTLTQKVVGADQTAPTFGPCTGGPFSLNTGNQPVSITAADEAGGSGLNASASTLTGSVSTSSVGQKTVTFTATDNQNNTATKTCSYQVAYVFAGFSAPVDNGLVNIAKAGQAVPFKFTVTDGTGAPVTNLTTASALAVTYACDATDGTDVLEEYATGSSGLQNLGGGKYQFNFKTLKSWAGSCRTLGIRLSDGINHSADFQFKS